MPVFHVSICVEGRFSAERDVRARFGLSLADEGPTAKTNTYMYE